MIQTYTGSFWSKNVILHCKIPFKGELKRKEIRRCYFVPTLLSQLLLKVHNTGAPNEDIVQNHLT